MNEKAKKFAVKSKKAGTNLINFGILYGPSIIKTIAHGIMGAMLFWLLGQFIPELREKLPGFYAVIDEILQVFDWMCKHLMYPKELLQAILEWLGR